MIIFNIKHMFHVMVKYHLLQIYCWFVL